MYVYTYYVAVYLKGWDDDGWWLQKTALQPKILVVEMQGRGKTKWMSIYIPNLSRLSHA